MDSRQFNLSILTNRQLAVYDLIHLPEKEIAWELDINIKTVKFHKGLLFRKLGVKSTREILYNNRKNPQTQAAQEKGTDF